MPKALLVHHSPLRRLDPRVKVLTSLVISFAAFPLGFAGLLVLFAVVVSTMCFARLLPAAWPTLRRMFIPLCVLFALNYLAARPRPEGGERTEPRRTERSDKNATSSGQGAIGRTRAQSGGKRRNRSTGQRRSRRRLKAGRRRSAVRKSRPPTGLGSHVMQAKTGFELVIRILTAASAFFLLTLTTTPEEFCSALTRFGVPYRIAFAIALAFRHLPLATAQLQLVRESQRLRGLRTTPPSRSLKGVLAWVRSAGALVVPGLVMTTRRAWEMTEAASARGFDSSLRTDRRQLRLTIVDVSVVVASIALVTCLFMLER